MALNTVVVAQSNREKPMSDGTLQAIVAHLVGYMEPRHKIISPAETKAMLRGGK